MGPGLPDREGCDLESWWGSCASGHRPPPDRARPSRSRYRRWDVKVGVADDRVVISSLYNSASSLSKLDRRRILAIRSTLRILAYPHHQAEGALDGSAP